MAARVIVERDDEGRLVVRKQAPGDRDGPTAEARWLRRAAGPGVVRLVDDGDDHDHDRRGGSGGLTTLHAGAHTWRTARLGPDRTCPVAAGVLRTVARLHRQCLVHGALGPDHIVLGPDGPVLCSPRPGADDPSTDRGALAELFETTAERWRGERRSEPAGWQRAVELLGRPGAGWTLDDIATLIDPGPAAGRTTTGRRWRPVLGTANPVPAGMAVLAVVAVVAVVVAALTVLAGVRSLTGTAGDAGGPAAALSGAAPPGSLEPAGRAVPDGDGQRSGRGGPGPAPARHGAARYRTSDGDGVLATADPACEGTPPGAVLDARTGDVWAFSTLPGTGEQVTGVAVQRVPGADRLEVRAEPTCRRIVAVGPAGEAAVPAVGSGR